MKLNKEQVLLGTVNVEKVTKDDLQAFITEHKLDVSVEGTKADILNDICDALEDADELNKTGAILGDTDVQGSSYLKRRAKQIAAGRGELAGIPSNLDDESKKSSYIARRLRR